MQGKALALALACALSFSTAAQATGTSHGDGRGQSSAPKNGGSHGGGSKGATRGGSYGGHKGGSKGGGSKGGSRGGGHYGGSKGGSGKGRSQRDSARKPPAGGGSAPRPRPSAPASRPTPPQLPGTPADDPSHSDPEDGGPEGDVVEIGEPVADSGSGSEQAPSEGDDGTSGLVADENGEYGEVLGAGSSSGKRKTVTAELVEPRKLADARPRFAKRATALPETGFGLLPLLMCGAGLALLGRAAAKWR